MPGVPTKSHDRSSSKPRNWIRRNSEFYKQFTILQMKRTCTCTYRSIQFFSLDASWTSQFYAALCSYFTIRLKLLVLGKNILLTDWFDLLSFHFPAVTN
ncbi:hypothetical protein Y032_0118g768 [Ancylostoma ceylanicum]|uniref:Uncharacterized protein n=1 Tax=Ancylostoma ceylanicum TaxID=53326 RepID=A0A016TBP2_9BILA|nr:hypothetical protein Y032_0118g768 [Ancylostoma ceylanicum]